MKKSFSALSGWYQLNYPSSWQFEIDEQGRYNFYNPTMGLGVLKISSINATDGGRIIGKDIIEDADKINVTVKNNNTIYFQKDSTDKQSDLHFWITEKDNVKVFCTYTLDKFLKSETGVEQEFKEINDILESLEFCA